MNMRYEKMPIQIWLTTNKRSLVCEESSGKSHTLVTLVSACPTNKFKSIITSIYGKNEQKLRFLNIQYKKHTTNHSLPILNHSTVTISICIPSCYRQSW